MTVPPPRRPQVALSKDFMEAYSRLPKPVQKKVRELTAKFQHDPTSPGLNFERVEGAADDKVRSLRVDQAYRAIVVHPPKGDVYLCAWVDHHDDAYAWVRRKRFEVNPLLGTLQLYEVVEREGPAVADEEPAAAGAPGLFDPHDDEDLLLAGVPQPLLAAVRACGTDEDYEALAPHLPPEAAEVLYLLAAGTGLAEALAEVEREPPEPRVQVDRNDFATAMERPESRRSFRVVRSGDELAAMLDAPLEQWRIFLHPLQRRVVEIRAKGPVRVLGGAGTGKTVALMHRAHHLASTVFTGQDDRLLVTTFTRNLALDLAANLRRLCGDSFARLEVVNLHAWCARFLRSHGRKLDVVTGSDRRELLEQAATEADQLGLEPGFYAEEWDGVVQAQEVRDRDAYLTARRTGRGTRLGRRQRAAAWEVFARYRELLEERGRVEWPDVVREARLFLKKSRPALPYRAVLADEVQDFAAGELKLLRAIAPEAPDSLYLVGDAHQRIYGQPVRLSSCDIEIRGRARRLRVNYRTTQEIRAAAVAVLEGRAIDDLDGGTDRLDGYHSLRHGPAPVIECLPSEAAEAERVLDTVRRWLAAGVPAESLVLAARTRAQLRERYQPLLEGAGVACSVVEAEPPEAGEAAGVRVATMHRLKGLEFPRVVLAGVHEGSVPPASAHGADAESEADHELRERCLLHVAMTRARDELVVLGFGRPSPLLGARTGA